MPDGGGKDGGPAGKDGGDAGKDGGDAGPSLTLDGCFSGLPARVGEQMIATKSSADGRVRVRLALDTLGAIGTAGTMPWSLIRFGVELDGVVTCVTEKSNLIYSLTHHNCMDVALPTVGGVRYELKAPDRATAVLTVSQGPTLIRGPVNVTDTSCAQRNDATVLPACRSGGPC